ncbi:MAG TPA: hypothetical protein VGA67_05895, partial [Candidatus Dojkabacteria bacterium]
LDMSADKIFFIRLMDREDISDNELWVVDADGLNAQSLGITGVNGVYNSTNDKIAVFSKANIYNKLFILDLETGEVEEIIEEDIDDAATANINANTTSISPDENIVAYSLNYYGTDCEDDGPCDYTEDPEVKSGFYAYNIATGERTYIGSFTYISSWSDDSQFVYSDGLGTDEYGNKTVKVNVETGVSALLDTKTNNLDSYYYISDNEKLILTGKTTGLETYTLKTFSLNEVFEEEVFAEVQSIRTEGCSDDEMYCIYQKRSNTISSTPIYKYRIINTETAEVEDLLVPEANENTGFAYWIDNEGIFTLVDVDTDYANYNSNELDQDIVFVDQETGVRMHLTDFGDVIFY